MSRRRKSHRGRAEAFPSDDDEASKRQTTEPRRQSITAISLQQMKLLEETHTQLQHLSTEFEHGDIEDIMNQTVEVQDKIHNILDDIPSHIKAKGNLFKTAEVVTDLSTLIANEAQAITVENHEAQRRKDTQKLLKRFGTATGGLDVDALDRFLFSSNLGSGLFSCDRWPAVRQFDIAADTSGSLDEPEEVVIAKQRKKFKRRVKIVSLSVVYSKGYSCIVHKVLII